MSCLELRLALRKEEPGCNDRSQGRRVYSVPFRCTQLLVAWIREGRTGCWSLRRFDAVSVAE